MDEPRTLLEKHEATTGTEAALQDIRNIGVAAHIDAGKTTVTERILFYSGLIHRMGEVHEGTTVTDWMEQERERGITIQAAAIATTWNGKRINIVDTPGHVDFTVEVERSLRVLDGAIIVLCGVSGVQPQTQTVWKQANRYRVPRLVFVNKLDRRGSDFFKVLADIDDKLTGVESARSNALAIQLPIGTEDAFDGMIDLVAGKAYVYDEKDSTGQAFTEVPIPADLKELYEQYRARMEERIIETDDALMSKYLEGSAIAQAELRSALRRAVCDNKIIPVLCGAAFKNKGIQFLLDAVVDYLPSPPDKVCVKGWLPDGTEAERAIDPEAPFCALSFKVVTDPFVGKLNFLRVYSGTVETGTHVLNPRTQRRERLSRILQIQADRRTEIQRAEAGDIVAAIGLKDTTTGDTLCSEKAPIVLETMKFPPPVISVAIEPKTKADSEKLDVSLKRLEDEDPTFKVHLDKETGQTIISGMGELHLEIIVDRLLREFNVKANVGRPQVAYRESIRHTGQAEAEWVRQTGGKGQYGQVVLQLDPLPRGTGFEFASKIAPGVIPKEFVPAIEQGIRETLSAGILAGFPVVDVKATALSAKYHEVDSTELAYRVAASIAFKQAFEKAEPALLEPIMAVDIDCPEEFTGDVIADLSSRRAQIQGIDTSNQHSSITANVPLSTMFGYATELRNKTTGMGGFSMQFLTDDEVPPAVAEAILNRYYGRTPYNE